MKNPILALFLAAIAFALSACSTVDSRIKEKQNIFDALTPVEQANIKQGMVEVGYTPDMVYMAMGKPDNIRDRTTKNGSVTTWIYNMYYQEYIGERVVGYRRDMYYDARAKAWRVYYTPVRESIYRNRTEEVGRVIFRNGKVESIEQVQ